MGMEQTEQQITVTKIEPHPVIDGWYIYIEGGTVLCRTTEQVRAMGLTIPAPDLTDFDAFPVGTVLADEDGDLLLRLPGGWTYNPPQTEDDYYDPAAHGSPHTVVYDPTPPGTLPAPDLTVTIDGHTATIGRDDAEAFPKVWGQISADDNPYNRVAVALADLIRTALEDTDG